MELNNSARALHYFREISKIPRGSGNMDGISDYLVNFAKNHSLKFIKDEKKNVIIFKDGMLGLENASPVILQGHMDMVCQKTADCEIDFERDPLVLKTEGDFLFAEGTTLGGDNGIAVAMALAVLESEKDAHPPIEAVFTVDEEIGLLGAKALDTSPLKAKKLINLDSEDEDVLTVSCAGGSDYRFILPYEVEEAFGEEIKISLFGLLGGHSGIDISRWRENSNVLLARVLSRLLRSGASFGISDIFGGDKSNAIPTSSYVKIVTEKKDEIIEEATVVLEEIKREISSYEKGFGYKIELSEGEDFTVMSEGAASDLIRLMRCAPNGIMNMSHDIEGLVETSLNFGILKKEKDCLILHFALRSNKKSALFALEERLEALADTLSCKVEKFGHYPPWEFKENSLLREIYSSAFEKIFSKPAKLEAIHAGLECGVFSDKIEGIDCIAMGPSLFDVHTPREKLSLSSTERIYTLLLEILKKCK